MRRIRWVRIVVAVAVVAATWLTSATAPTAARDVAPRADDPSAEDLEAWAAAAHRDLLGREATPEEVADVRDRVLAGTATRGDVAAELARSDEWVGTVVTELYEHVLGRGPDADGLAYWVARIQAGDRVATVAVSIYGSQEYWVRASSARDTYVRALYRDILDRAPDGDGLQYWVGRLAGGTPRWVVARALFLSAEARGRRVGGLYGELLGRRAAADERDYWVGRLATIDDIHLAAFLVGSDEYLALAVDPPPPIGPATELVPPRDFAFLGTPVIGISGDGDTVAVPRATNPYHVVIEAIELADGTVDELADARPFNGAVVYQWTLTRPSLTEHGRLVAMGDGGPRLFDRNAGTATDLGPGSVFMPALPGVISADGTTVAYVRHVVVEGSDPVRAVRQVEVRPRTGTTPTWVSAGDDDSTDPQLSRDGRWLVFSSEATDLVAGDDNGQADVFLRDLATGTTQRLTDGDGPSTEPWISADGTTVAFTSTATDLVAGEEADDGAAADIYTWDATDGTALVSDGATAADGPTLSADGRLVAYRQVRAGEGPTRRQPVLVDRATDTTTSLTASASGVLQVQVAADGSRLVTTTYVEGEGQRYAVWGWDLALT
jgi:hypothetical protein